MNGFGEPLGQDVLFDLVEIPSGSLLPLVTLVPISFL